MIGVSSRYWMVLDGAGWHSSPTWCLPLGIHILFLPPCSTFVAADVERLWPLSGAGYHQSPLPNAG